MARLTKEERATLDALAARAKAEDDDDAAAEIVVENAAGHKVHLTGAKARAYMRKHGLDDLDDDGDAGDDEDDLPDDPPAKKKESYFAGKTKKPAAA
jgi:hypothetical protein